MHTFLNIHTHRPATDASESVVRNYILQDTSVGEEIPSGTLFSAGIHPWHLPDNPENACNRLERLAVLPNCIAIGECGLDKAISADIGLQNDIFRRQIDMAVRLRMPLVVHCAKAWNELYALRKDMPAELACIVHGFRGKPALAEQLTAKGFYLSFGFHFHPESLRNCPPDKLFLETDESPYSIDRLYHSAAGLRQCTAGELNAQCWENLRRIVPKSKKTEI